MSNIRKILACQFLGGLLAAHASAAIQINFDNAADLSGNFTVSLNSNGIGTNATPVAYSGTSGVGGGGGLLALDNSQEQYAILNSAFALVPGTVYSVSSQFRRTGYVGVGFADANSYASIDFQPANSIMLSLQDEGTMHVSSYSNGNPEWDNNDVLPNSIASVPAIPAGSWMLLNLSMTYNGLNNFDLAYTVDICGEDGIPLNRALDGSYSVTNAGLSANLHPFIFFQDIPLEVNTIAADNFRASAVPEPSTAMAAMIGLTLGSAVIRRRQRPC